MKKLYTIVAVIIATAFILTACGAQTPAATEAPATQAAVVTQAPAATDTPAPTAVPDLLSTIQTRGYILVSTDPNYEPQSFLDTAGKRPAGTKCPSDALTTAEMKGFDVDVAHKIGDALKVETCFATPSWDLITAGNWANKWDISVGSMTITTARQKVLNFSVPYYYTPAVVAVGKDSGFTKLDDLAGKPLCAGTSTTYETWITGGDLGLPATSIYAKPPTGVTVVSLATDQECAQAIKSGRKDFVGYVTSATVVDANIAAGLSVMKLGSPVYSEDLAVAIDKGATLPTDTLLKAIDTTITTMHTDGTLTALSTQWFKSDLTQAPK